MRFQPMSDKEIDALGLLPPGTYDFEVLESSDEVSKNSGNEMIKLKLSVFDEGGRDHHIYDYLVASDAGMCVRKIKHFSACVGQLDQYEQGTLDADALIGVGGKVSVSVEESAQYGAQNRVEDYVVPAGYITSAEKKKKNKEAEKDGEAMRTAPPTDEDKTCPF